MKRVIVGALVGACLLAVVAGLFDARGVVLAQKAASFPPAPVSGDLIAIPSASADKGQMLTVIDPRQQTIGVYSIEPSTGKIALRSVRNVRWDLQMTDFNSDNPLPREIRLQLEQR